MPANGYDRAKAVAYAHKWAYKRNPQYYNFENLGGDCTNFISQVLYAGSGVMNNISVLGWYYLNINRRTPSWTGVEFLYRFLINNKGIGPYAEKTSISRMEPGDIIQLKFGQNHFQHSLAVVSTISPVNTNNLLIATHTDDSDYRPVSSYQYSDIRFLHLLGARK